MHSSRDYTFLPVSRLTCPYDTSYPFNLGKRVKGLGVVGNRLSRSLAASCVRPLARCTNLCVSVLFSPDISDWETVMVRTVDGEAVSVDYRESTRPPDDLYMSLTRDLLFPSAVAHTGNYGEG